MTIRLISLEILPLAHDGWGTPILDFGASTTLVTGGNGAGKTPVLRALAIAFGARIELPQLVLKHCLSVRVKLATEDGIATIERRLDQRGAHLTVGGETVVCRNDEEFSSALFALLDIPPRVLVRRDNSQPSPPYMSVLTPLFYVDQDHGWTDVYQPAPRANFLADQREEALRWILALSPRNYAKTRAERDNARAHATAIRDAIAAKRKLIEALRRELGDDAHEGARSELETSQMSLRTQLRDLVGSFESMSKVDASLETAFRSASTAKDVAVARVRAIETQAAAMQRTRNEVVDETSVLEANEVAAGVFRALCGNVDCNLFRPQDSYGRRLLHMRDQVKDLDAAAATLGSELELARAAVSACDDNIGAIRHQQRARLTASGADAFATEIERLSKAVSSLAVRIDRIERMAVERGRLARLLERAEEADEAVRALASVRTLGGGNRVTDVRKVLARTTHKWLDAMKAQNLGTEVTFDSELHPYIGGERFGVGSSQSGSTRHRIVLALHAALIETSLEMGGHHPRFLVLDAPRQQEMDLSDLISFVAACEKLFASYEPPLQLIVGATTSEMFTRPPDAVWSPSFKVQPTSPTDSGHRYLGSRNLLAG